MIFLLSKSIHLKKTQETLQEVLEKKESNFAVIVNANLEGYHKSIGSKTSIELFENLSQKYFGVFDLYKDEINFGKFNSFYFIGGNPFSLARAIRETGFDKKIREKNLGNLIFGGNSAGAMIMGKSLQHVTYYTPEYEDDKNLEFSNSCLKLVDKMILPHCKLYEEKTKNYSFKHEILNIQDGEIKIIESYV